LEVTLNPEIFIYLFMECMAERSRHWTRDCGAWGSIPGIKALGKLEIPTQQWWVPGVHIQGWINTCWMHTCGAVFVRRRDLGCLKSWLNMHRYNTIMYLLVYQLVLRERKGGGSHVIQQSLPTPCSLNNWGIKTTRYLLTLNYSPYAELLKCLFWEIF